MKKFFLSSLLLSGLIAGHSYQAEAQANATLGARLIVNSPSSLFGSKVFTYSSDTHYSGAWGGDISSTVYYHVPLVKGLAGTDSLAQTTLTNAAQVSGKWVLVFRGINQFSQKALICQQAGAAGVIIVNNVPGAGPVGMGAGTSAGSVTIPVLMVGNTDGLAMNAALDAGIVDTISLSTWGFNQAHDLAIVPGSTPVMAAGAIPLSQLNAGSTAKQYNIYNGGFVANIGNNSESNISLHGQLSFTPTAGAATVLNNDSVAIGTLAGRGPTADDSLAGSYSSNIYHPNPSAKGRYDLVNYVTFGNVDNDSPDDTVKNTMFVTDSVFCLSRWDNVKGEPIATGSYGISGQDMAWGPLYYMADGPYRAASVQFAINDGDTTKHSLNSSPAVFVYMYKWVDGDNGLPADSIMQTGELQPVGIAGTNFGINDSNDHFVTVAMNDLQTTPGSSAYMSKNSYYYFAVNCPTPTTLDADGNTSFYGRLVASKQNTGFPSFFSPNILEVESAFAADPTVSFDMIPFNSTTNNPDSVGIRALDGSLPSFALHTSKNHDATSVTNVTGAKSLFTMYPNPAVSEDIHVKMSLSANSPIVEFNIVDGLGRTVYRDTRHNMQNEDVTLPTAKLAAGQYILGIHSNEGTVGKAFTILAK